MRVEGMRAVALILIFASTAAMSHEKKPNIVEAAIATDSLSGLVGALTLPGQKPVFDALQGSGPFTVFAPTNGGFEALKTLKNPDGLSLYDFVTKAENAAVLVRTALADRNDLCQGFWAGSAE